MNAAIITFLKEHLKSGVWLGCEGTPTYKDSFLESFADLGGSLHYLFLAVDSNIAEENSIDYDAVIKDYEWLDDVAVDLPSCKCEMPDECEHQFEPFDTGRRWCIKCGRIENYG